MPCGCMTAISFGWQDPWTVCYGPPWSAARYDVIAGVMLAFAWPLPMAGARLIRPINELKLDDPLENEIYEEITPLLKGLMSRTRKKTRSPI